MVARRVSVVEREEPVTTRLMGPRPAVKRRLPGEVPLLGRVQETRREHTTSGVLGGL